VKSPNFLIDSIRLLLLISLPAIAYFQDLVQVFNLALTDLESQYILLVPFFAVFFLYRRRRALLIHRKNSFFQDLFGVSLCLLALLVHVWGSYSFYPLQLHLLSLPIFVAGLMLVIFGADVLRILIFPVALLAFLSPFPLMFMDSYGGNLITSVADLVTFVLRPFLQVGLSYKPVVILSTVTAAGEPVQFSIGAACSGIYSLTAFLFCGVVFGYLAAGSPVRKVVFAAISLIIAYFLNVLRISTMVLLGHFSGIGLAVDFFHLTGGLVLTFVGMLVLLFLGSRVLKLSFLKRETMHSCPASQESATICRRCGLILGWPRVEINWRRLAIFSLFLLICADLILQASAINYNAVTQQGTTAVSFNPATGEFGPLYNLTGWSTYYIGRDSLSEETLGLKFVGNYVLSSDNATRAHSSDVFAYFEVSDLQSKFHTWEGCLRYQEIPMNIEKITYSTLFEESSNIIIGETIVASAPSINQTLVLFYWFDTLNLRTNETATVTSIKVTFIEYMPDTENQTAQTANIEASEAELFSIAQGLEKTWGQYKESNNTFAVDIYRNREILLAIVAAFLVASTATLTAARLMKRANARRKISQLPEDDKILVRKLTEGSVGEPGGTQPSGKIYEEILEEFQRQGILHEKIVVKGNEIFVKTASY
jgi:exosortase